jgi:hypothetical protein
MGQGLAKLEAQKEGKQGSTKYKPDSWDETFCEHESFMSLTFGKVRRAPNSVLTIRVAKRSGVVKSGVVLVGQVYAAKTRGSDGGLKTASTNSLVKEVDASEDSEDTRLGGCLKF